MQDPNDAGACMTNERVQFLMGLEPWQEKGPLTHVRKNVKDQLIWRGKNKVTELQVNVVA